MASSRKHKQFLVWDLPTRTFHWGLALSFLIAYLTREDDHLALVHIASGFTFLSLLIFRIIWGFIGTRHARFADFILGPRATIHYLKSLFSPKPIHYLGHNPAGGFSILALLGLGLITTLSGWLEYEDLELPFLEEIHEGASEILLVVVLIHIAAVILSTIRHRENLILAMMTGKKKGSDKEPPIKNHPLIAIGLVGMTLCIWLWLYRHKWLSLIH